MSEDLTDKEMKGRILVIEYHQELRETLEMALSLEGYELSLAENGEKGLQHALTSKPDLIICDLELPVMSGLHTYEQVSQSSELANVPFIFVSAKNDQRAIRDAMNMGADDCLTMPFTIKELVNVVNTRLEKAMQIRQAYDRKVEKLQAKIEQYSFMNSHDVRGPLTNMLGLINLLANIDEEEMEMALIIEMLQKTGNKMDEVVQQINQMLNQSDKAATWKNPTDGKHHTVRIPLNYGSSKMR